MLFRRAQEEFHPLLDIVDPRVRPMGAAGLDLYCRRQDGSEFPEERLRHSREQLRDLSARWLSIREEERTRISRVIHDELGQALTGLKMDVAWL